METKKVIEIFRLVFEFPVGIIGIALNTLILFKMPGRRTQISPIAKTYYCITAVADLLIMHKTLINFLSKINCQTLTSPIIKIPCECNLFWKSVMTVWLVAEIVSNYSILWLNFEKFLSLCFPLKFRIFRSLKKQVTIFSTAISPVLIYAVYYSIKLYRLQYTNEKTSIMFVEVDITYSNSKQFRILSKIFCFIFPTTMSLILSLIILWKMKQISRERRELTRNQNPERAASSLFRLARIAVALSLINFILYTPSILFWFVYDFITLNANITNNTEQVNNQKENLVAFGMLFGSIASLGHVLNFFVYYFYIPSFKRRFQLCNQNDQNIRVAAFQPYPVRIAIGNDGSSAQGNKISEMN